MMIYCPILDFTAHNATYSQLFEVEKELDFKLTVTLSYAFGVFFQKNDSSMIS